MSDREDEGGFDRGEEEDEKKSEDESERADLTYYPDEDLPPTRRFQCVLTFRLSVFGATLHACSVMHKELLDHLPMFSRDVVGIVHRYLFHGLPVVGSKPKLLLEFEIPSTSTRLDAVVACGPTGLLHACTRDRVYTFTDEGQLVTEFRPTERFEYFNGLAVDTSGHLYIPRAKYKTRTQHGDCDGSVTVHKYTGELVRVCSEKDLVLSAGYMHPVLVSTEAEILVASACGDHRVSAHEAYGYNRRWFVTRDSFAVKDFPRMCFFGSVREPSGMAENSRGHLFISDRLQHRIYVHAANHRELCFIGQDTVDDVSEFKEPGSMAIDGDDILYLCDDGNNRVAVMKAQAERVPGQPRKWRLPFITEFPYHTTSADKFGPSFIAVGFDGCIYLSQCLNIFAFAFPQ